MGKRKKKTRALPLLLLLPLLLAGCARQAEQDLLCMDTVMRFTLHGRRADRALAACVEEIHALEARFSVTREGSDASCINAAGGGAVRVGADTLSLLQTARAVSELTGGAFDVTVYPLVEAWGFPGDARRVPDAEALRALLPLVGMDRLRVDGDTVWAEPGTRVDFGGIAKGFASNRLVELAAEYGIQSALFTLGGNVQALGSKPDGSAWRIGVMDPRDPSDVIGVLSVRDCAVITAGGYQRYFEADGVRYHHILDPHTGCPAEAGLLSATVVSGDGAMADALSTALFVLGEAEAVRLYRDTGGFEMLLVRSDGSVLVTENLDFSASDGVRMERILP